MRKNMTKAIALGAIVLFCLAGASSAVQTGIMDSLSAKEWAEDLDFLASELPKRHKNLFFKLSEERFFETVKDFRSRIPVMEREEILVGFMKILASVGDSHTDTYIRPSHALPLMLYWFDDGVAVLNTTKEYEEALYGRITAIGGYPLEEVIEAFGLVIPHENDAQVKNKLGSLLTRTDILFGLGLIPDKNKASLTFRDEEGVEQTLEFQAVPMSSRPEWMVDSDNTENVPLYRQNADLFYWYRYLPDSRTIYIKYNACRNIPEQPFPEFTAEVFDFLDRQNVRRLVIDLRHNGGGNSGIFAPFLDEIKKREPINQKGHLYVLIGRRTFSSAILNALELKNQTAALLAGEPTGGKPNHFGEIKLFQLPHSKIPIQYSTKYFAIASEDTSSLLPDIPVEVNLDDYLNDVDPVLEAVIKRESPGTGALRGMALKSKRELEKCSMKEYASKSIPQKKGKRSDKT
jgi:hypothetical protein